MKSSRLAQALVALCSLALFATATTGHGKQPPTAPGKYTEWDGSIDELEIVQPFQLRGFRRILVLPIDISGVEMPTDNSRRPLEKVLADCTAYMAEQLDNEMPNRLKIKGTATPADTDLRRNAGAIILRSRFTEMNPGSAAARTFSRGFAGATHITMKGEFIDGGTGQVLLRFSLHNYHSKAGLISRYMSALEENMDQIAESLGDLLKKVGR